MKKSFRILLTLALAFVMVLSLTACASDCELGKHTLEDVSAQSATCTQDGVIAHKHCTVCDGYFDLSGNKLTKEQTVVPALGHTISEHPAVAPTCTETGLTEGSHCSRCDYSVTQEEVPALGHDLVINNEEQTAGIPQWIKYTKLSANVHHFELNGITQDYTIEVVAD